MDQLYEAYYATALISRDFLHRLRFYTSGHGSDSSG